MNGVDAELFKDLGKFLHVKQTVAVSVPFVEHGSEVDRPTLRLRHLLQLGLQLSDPGRQAEAVQRR